MNKTELVSAMAEKSKLSKKDAESALKAFTDVVTEQLAKKDSVQLIGFGTFSTSERKERKAKNPKDGSEMVVPACTVARFKAGSALKAILK